VAVVTNYLDARGVRVADAVGTSCSARLAGTVGVPLRRVTPSRRSPGSETARSRERNFRPRVTRGTKPLARMYSLPRT